MERVDHSCTDLNGRQGHSDAYEGCPPCSVHPPRVFSMPGHLAPHRSGEVGPGLPLADDFNRLRCFDCPLMRSDGKDPLV